MTNERASRYGIDAEGRVWRFSRVAGWRLSEVADRDGGGWTPTLHRDVPRRVSVGSRSWWPLPGEPVNVVGLPRDRTALLMRALSGLGGIARRHSAAAFAGYTGEVFSRRCPACGWWARRAVDDGSCRVCRASMTCEVAS